MQKESPDERLQRFEERRKYPRIIVNCPIYLLLSNDEKVKAIVYDVSPGGIQVRCDRITAHKVQYEYESFKEKASTKFKLIFMLPLEGKEEKVGSTCRLAFIMRLENDRYAIGMEFIEMENVSRKTLKRFIEISMEPI